MGADRVELITRVGRDFNASAFRWVLEVLSVR